MNQYAKPARLCLPSSFKNNRSITRAIDTWWRATFPRFPRDEYKTYLDKEIKHEPYEAVSPRGEVLMVTPAPRDIWYVELPEHFGKDKGFVTERLLDLILAPGMPSEQEWKGELEYHMGSCPMMVEFELRALIDQSTHEMWDVIITGGEGEWRDATGVHTDMWERRVSLWIKN